MYSLFLVVMIPGHAQEAVLPEEKHYAGAFVKWNC